MKEAIIIKNDIWKWWEENDFWMMIIIEGRKVENDILCKRYVMKVC